MKHAVMLVAAVIVLAGLGSMTAASFGSLFVRLWGGADDFTLTSSGAQDLTAGIMIEWEEALRQSWGCCSASLC
jgi:flagellar biosynthetic protein FlhB